jgi:predicted nuclease of predicted toxin-antitoxin system
MEKPIIDWLLKEGYDIKWIPDFDFKMNDESLLNMANREKRILITNDKDFGELTFLQRKVSTGIILMRFKGQLVKDKLIILPKIFRIHSDRLLGHFTVVTKKKIRFIPMEGVK